MKLLISEPERKAASTERKKMVQLSSLRLCKGHFLFPMTWIGINVLISFHGSDWLFSLFS
jgi:hypothetical protein